MPSTSSSFLNEHIYFLCKILQVLYKNLFTNHDSDNIKAAIVQNTPGESQSIHASTVMKNTGSLKALGTYVKFCDLRLSVM